MSQILDVASKLGSDIEIVLVDEGFEVEAIRMNREESSPSREMLLKHSLWLVGEIPILLSVKKREKAMRWMAFVQGVMVSLGVCTVADMRRYNRSDDKPEE